MKPQNRTARDRKIARRKGRNWPVHGVAMKRLLVERAATAQRERVDGEPSYAKALSHMNGSCGINEAHSDEDHES